MTSYDPPAWEYIIPPEHRKTAAEARAEWDRMGWIACPVCGTLEVDRGSRIPGCSTECQEIADRRERK